MKRREVKNKGEKERYKHLNAEFQNITAYGDCSHEIKRCLLLGRKVMTNLDSILKSRDCFANKGPSSQGYGFSRKLSAKELMLLKCGVEEDS